MACSSRIPRARAYGGRKFRRDSQQVEVGAVADGVIVGSALVRRLLEGEGPEGAARFVGQLRRALDGS